MTRPELLAEVDEYLQVDAQVAARTSDRRNTLVQRALDHFTYDTLCLYDDNVSMTTESGVARYTTTDLGVFSRRLVMPKAMSVDDHPVFNEGYYLGSTSLSTWEETRQYKDPARPSGWIMAGTDQIILTPTPDDAYNLRWAGHVYHDLVINDIDDLEIPLRHEHTLIVYTAVLFLGARAQGSTLEKMQRLSAEAAANMEKLVSHAATAWSNLSGKIVAGDEYTQDQVWT